MRMMAGRVSQNLVRCGHPTKIHAKTGTATAINTNPSSPPFLFKTFQVSLKSTRIAPPIPIRLRLPLPLRIACQPDNNTTTTTNNNNSSNPNNDEDDGSDNDDSGAPNKQVSKRVAVVSCVAALGLFLSSRFDFGVSLSDLTALALPYDQALSNGKPTVVEFYADWCEVCRELAPQVYKVEQQYQDRVNFVMLNVDNTKWEQEIDEFGVEGIPHFAFLDKDGNEQGNVVGRLPPQYFLDNVDALARAMDSLPHARLVGQYSNTQPTRVHQVPDPRSHG